MSVISIFALTLYCWVLSEEATNTHIIVVSLTRTELEYTIYRTRGEHANHYTTDAVTKPREWSCMCVLGIFIGQKNNTDMF